MEPQAAVYFINRYGKFHVDIHIEMIELKIKEVDICSDCKQIKCTALPLTTNNAAWPRPAAPNTELYTSKLHIIQLMLSRHS